MNKFIVISSNASNEGKTFVTKMSRSTIIPDELFGNKTKKETLYISAPNQLKQGLEITEDQLFPKYRIEEHEMINPETKDKFMGKWLHCN